MSESLFSRAVAQMYIIFIDQTFYDDKVLKKHII